MSLAQELKELFEDKGVFHLAREADVIATLVEKSLWLGQIKFEEYDRGAFDGDFDGYQRGFQDGYEQGYQSGLW